jgi:hypothetical protein
MPQLLLEGGEIPMVDRECVSSELKPRRFVQSEHLDSILDTLHDVNEVDPAPIMESLNRCGEILDVCRLTQELLECFWTIGKCAEVDMRNIGSQGLEVEAFVRRS